MKVFKLVAPLWAMTLTPAFAMSAINQDLQVSATLTAAEFRVDPIGHWPERTRLTYQPEADDFRAFSRDLEIKSTVGGVQVRQTSDFRLVDENNQVNQELDLFVGFSGPSGKGGLVPSNGTPLVLMEASGWSDFNVALWTERAIPPGQRLTPGSYSADLNLLFEVLAP
ncbi:MAG: CS1 type fimbrial major subunit [Pseudomonas sp.]